MDRHISETPIVRYERDENNNTIYMKRDDLLPYCFGGNKVRIARAYFNDMKRKGCNCMLMYGNARSNLCRVLANLCYAENIPCIMIASSEEGETAHETANSRMVDWMRVEVIHTTKSGIAAAVDTAFALARNWGLKPYYIFGNRLGEGNEGTAASAYAEAFDEILIQEQAQDLSFDYIFHASGTGATQTGLICGQLLAGTHKKIRGISISRDRARGERIIRRGVEAYFAGIGKRLPEQFEKEIVLSDDYLAGGYGVATDEIRAFVKEEFCQRGVPFDTTYTGKAFLGMEHYLADCGIRNQSVLFIHTGGTPLFFDALLPEA